MSQQQATQAEEQTPVIGLAGKRKWGYNVQQVDDFLERAHELYEADEPSLTQEQIQLQSFELEHNGYIIGQVDATLIRLEKAVVDKQTHWDIAHEGRQAWEAETRRLALTLQERAELPAKARFKPGEKKAASYHKKQVDTLVDQAWAHISKALHFPDSQNLDVKGEEDINAAQVANVIFTQKHGKKGYDEASVDAYLNRVVQVLTRLESIVRITAGNDVQIADEEISPEPLGTGVSSAAVAGAIPTSAAHASDTPTADSLPAQTPVAPVSNPSEEAETPSAEETASFAPVSEPDQSEPDQEDQDQSKGGSSSLASLVHTTSPKPEVETNPDVPPSFNPQTGEQQAAPLTFFDQSAPENAPSSQDQDQEPPLPATDAPREQQQPAEHAAGNPEPDASTESGTSAHEEENNGKSESSASAPDPDPEQYISSVLQQTTLQTNSFEIPNLTFPATDGKADDESQKKGNVQTGDSKDTEEHQKPDDSSGASEK